MKISLLVFPVVLLAVFASCSKSKTDSSVCQGGTDEFSLNEPFTLCYGASAHFEDNASFTIKFSEVFGDSRCASDAICVWEGRIDAGVQLTLGQTQSADTLSKGGLGANTAKDSVFFQNYKVKLLSVEPYPALSTGTIPQEDYKLKLLVTQ